MNEFAKAPGFVESTFPVGCPNMMLDKIMKWMKVTDEIKGLEFCICRHTEEKSHPIGILPVPSRDRITPVSKSDFLLTIKWKGKRGNKTNHTKSPKEAIKIESLYQPRRMTIPGNLLYAITCSQLTNSSLRASPFIPPS